MVELKYHKRIGLIMKSKISRPTSKQKYSEHINNLQKISYDKTYSKPITC